MADLQSSIQPEARSRGSVVSRDRGPLGRVQAFADRRFFVLAALPAFLIVFLVTVLPVVFAVYLSLTSYTPVTPSYAFRGLRNYHLLLNDPNAPIVIVTTLVFVAVALTAEIVLGVGAALLLATPLRGIGFFRTLYLVPLMVAGIASAISWRALFNTSNGWINYLLGLAHLPQPNWLADPTTALPAVIVADTWSGRRWSRSSSWRGCWRCPRNPSRRREWTAPPSSRRCSSSSCPGSGPCSRSPSYFVW